MKNYITFKTITLYVLVMIFTVSCSDDDNIPEPIDSSDLTITELALASPGLSSLVDALVQADGNLPNVLNGTGPFTVLAPTNTAFQELLDSNPNWNSISDIDSSVLQQVLLNHVITGNVMASDLITSGSGYTNTNAEGPGGNKLSLYFDTSSGVEFNGVASVVTDGADIVAKNGTIHVIDAVIGLPTLATFATSNPDLSILVDAMAYADTGNPTVSYINTVSDSTAGPFTVFAPTNEAFASLLSELNLNALTDLSTEEVNGALSMHIIAGANLQSGDLTSGSVQVLSGESITANTDNFTLTDNNNRVSNIVTDLIDIQAINGVVHVIDKVILPQQP